MANRKTLSIYHVAFTQIDIKHFLSFYDLLELTGNQNKNTAGLLPQSGDYRLTQDTFVWRVGLENWVKAKYLSELAPLFTMPPDVPDEIALRNNLPNCIGTETIAEAIAREATSND